MNKPVLFPDIHRHRALFFRVHQFNLLPTRYVHSSWLQDIGSDMQMDIRKIWEKNPRVEKHCAAMIIKKFCHGFIYDFPDEIWQAVLLANAELAKLMIYAGLMIHMRSILQTISGRHIRALTEAFGPQAYEFATNRAPLLAGADGFDGLQPPGSSGVRLPADIMNSGRLCLQICLEGAPEPLVRRLCLKFPRKMGWDFTPRSAAAARTACRRIIQKVIKMEIHPSWQTASP